MHVFGRLKPAMTAEQARTALQPWFHAMLEADTGREGFPNVTAEQRRNFLASTIDVLPAARGLSNLRGSLERPLWVLLGGTTLLLLLASLNVASLLLARGTARGRELATRMALGASRGRIAGQLLVETMLLTLGGGLLGLVLAPVVSQLLLSFLSPADLTFQIDHRVFLFAFLASIMTAGLCGLGPAFQAGRISLTASLKEGSRITAAGGVPLRKALVGAQIAFTLILLIGAGLFIQTLARLHGKVEFVSSNLLTFSVDPPSSGYSESDAEQAMRELHRRLQDVPGVESVAVANTRLLSGGTSTTNMTIQSDERIVTDRPTSYMRVGPGFFSTLGTQVIAGRDFDERDVRAPGSKPTGWRSAIVNESFARRYFKGRSPVGFRLGTGNRPNTATDIEIIGVVRDFSRRSLRDEELEQAFFPYWDNQSGDGAFYVKMRGNPESAFASIRAAVEQVDRILPVLNLTTFEDQIDRSLATERMLATLSSGFGAIALLLSVVGLYGVMSFVVAQRTQEIGIRMALGATRSAVVWLIVRDALVVIGAGIAIALPCAWGLRRLVEAQIFGVRALDGPTIAGASCLLAFVALAAAMLPAWRAASVNPTEALRFE
jgi:predicted permease